ncbi:MAG: RNA-binding protein [Bacteroidota bacterium]
MNIYVGNLSFNTSNEDLRLLFESYGDVDAAKVVINQRWQRSKGFGFVEMTWDDHAKAAISALQGTEFMGRPIKVAEAKPLVEKHYAQQKQEIQEEFNEEN